MALLNVTFVKSSMLPVRRASLEDAYLASSFSIFWTFFIRTRVESSGIMSLTFNMTYSDCTAELKNSLKMSLSLSDLALDIVLSFLRTKKRRL